MFDAFSAVNPAPLPVKELPALLNVLAPLNVCVPLRLSVRLVPLIALIVLVTPVKVFLAFSRGTFDERRASASVPLEMFDAFSAVSPAPLPVKELPALLNVLAPVNVCVPLSNA